MLRYAAVRLVQGVIVMWIVVTVVFLLSRMSGDTASIMAPPDAPQEVVDAIARSMGLDRPLVVQYFDYLGDLFRGDLGESFSYRQPVSTLITKSLPNSIRLGVVAFTFAGISGITIGMLSALRPNGIVDRLGKGLALLGQSVPSFWLGILLVSVFAVRFGWFPAYGSGSWKHIVLPAIALGWYPLAALTRLTRSSVIEVMRKDHTQFNRAKGLSPASLLVHTLRSASLPLVTLAGIQLGVLFSGAVVIETLFAWPGIGQLAIQAINARDYNVVQGVVLVNTIIFVLLLFLVDISYGILDPRVRGARRGARGA